MIKARKALKYVQDYALQHPTRPMDQVMWRASFTHSLTHAEQRLFERLVTEWLETL